MTEGLSLEGVRSILGRISYKPGWRIEVHEDVNNIWMLRCEHRTIDSRNGMSTIVAREVPFPRALVEGQVTHPTFTRLPEQEVIKFVRGALFDLELHEMEEWFALDGYLYSRPHNEEEPVHVFQPVQPRLDLMRPVEPNLLRRPVGNEAPERYRVEL